MIVDIQNKNPFNVLMGILLRHYRLEKKLTSKEMSLRLNSGHSLYRLMESGASPLHPSKIHLLIKTLEDLYEDLDIEFDNLSKFLVGGQYIDALVNRKQRSTSRGLTFNEAMQELLNSDTVGFVKLFENTKEVFDPKTKKERLNYLINEKAPLELFDFLALNNYKKTKIEQYEDEVIETFLNSYSLHTEIILSMAKEFNTHPPLHISGIADKWEKKNKKRFKYLRGVYLKEEIVINEKNFELFDFEYLFEDSFKEMKILFISEKPSIQLEQKFINELNKSRRKNKNKELTELEIEKINIRTISKKDINSLQDLIKENKGLKENDVLAYWSFSMHSGNENGFIGYRERDNERDYVLNLKYKEAKERIKIFEDRWSNIN